MIQGVKDLCWIAINNFLAAIFVPIDIILEFLYAQYEKRKK